MTEYISNSDFSDSSIYGDDVTTHLPATLTDTATYPIAAITLPLSIRINGVLNDYYLSGLETTASDVATTLNGALPGVTAEVDGGQVKLTTENTGAAASLQVEPGGANLTLGFPTTIYVGDDGSFEGTGTDIVTAVGGSATASKQAGSRTGGVGSQVLRLTKTGAPNGLLRISDALIVGQAYRLTGWGIGDGTSAPSFRQTQSLWSGRVTVDWQEADFTFLSTATYIDLAALSGAAANYVEFDDIEIVPIYSIHGGATDWQRTSSQSVGGWADFNSASYGGVLVTLSTPDYHDVVAREFTVELFEAGWLNNQRMESFLGTDIGAAEFSNLAPAYSNSIESFELWDGPPWLDSYDVMGPYDETPPTGWNGWYNDDYASTDVALTSDSFEESWGNDPFHSTYSWVSGTAVPNGILVGESMTFPLTIYASNRVLWILYRTGATATLYKLIMTLGDYASAAAVAAHLNTLLPAAMSSAGFEFDSWSSGGSSGITFGYDGSTDTTGTDHEALFCTIYDAPYYQDSREDLGMDKFSILGTLGAVLYPCSILTGALPSGVSSDDVLIVDPWSQILYNSDDTYGAGLLYYGYGVTDATFDSTLSGDTNIEQMLLTGWFGAGATWQSSLSGVTAASFVGPVTLEQFVDTDWPGEIM